MSAVLNSRRRVAAKDLRSDATPEQIERRLLERMSDSMISRYSVALQAAESGSLYVDERHPAIPDLEELALITVRADRWVLTPRGEELLSEWRRKARWVQSTIPPQVKPALY